MEYNWKVGEVYETLGGSKRKIVAINKNFPQPILTISVDSNRNSFDTNFHFINGKVHNGFTKDDLLLPKEYKESYTIVTKEGWVGSYSNKNSMPPISKSWSIFKQTYYKDHKTGKWVFEKSEEYQP